jgi:hypothetical protein
MTLARLVTNGIRVNKEDVIAEFDRTEQLDDAKSRKGWATRSYEDKELRIIFNRSPSRNGLRTKLWIWGALISPAIISRL